MVRKGNANPDTIRQVQVRDSLTAWGTQGRIRRTATPPIPGPPLWAWDSGTRLGMLFRSNNPQPHELPPSPLVDLG